MPGGTVLKNESRTEAVHRVAEEELGESVIIDGGLGTYEHFYDTSEIRVLTRNTVWRLRTAAS